MAAERIELAPAKINLTLRVLRRRADGYHDIESLVVFAAIGDRLSLVRGAALSLAVRGPFAKATGAVEDNLVLKAANALAKRVPGLKLGRFVLTKQVPVAAGLGGGSADAAAALRLLARANRIALDDPRLVDAARATGADVPVCLDPRPRVMRGIGDVLSAPIQLPKLPVVLVNPGGALATRDVFAALRLPPAAPAAQPLAPDDVPREREALVAWLRREGSDLEWPAIGLAPAIGDVLAALNGLPACRLVRMSGSGATCFGLIESLRGAAGAARALRARHPQWWIRATVLGG